jgi:GNAT superfamily N-acetyltransferase
MPALIWRPSGMTNAPTVADEVTDRALTASVDRVVRAARAMQRPHHVDDEVAVVWMADRGFYSNLAYVRQPPDDWHALVARIGSVVPAGRPVSLITPVDVPDLGDGWQRVGHPPLMVRPAGPGRVTPPAGLRVVEVEDEPMLAVFERTIAEAYPDPTLLPYRWGSFQDGRVLGDRSHFYVAHLDGEAVGTAIGHVAAGVNLVEGISTRPAARGRGCGAVLTWAAATVDPSLPAVLIASDLGRPVYERLGFVEVHRWTFWHRPR